MQIIKNCPFCGGEATVHGVIGYTVECDNCEA